MLARVCGAHGSMVWKEIHPIFHIIIIIRIISAYQAVINIYSVTLSRHLVPQASPPTHNTYQPSLTSPLTMTTTSICYPQHTPLGPTSSSSTSSVTNPGNKEYGYNPGYPSYPGRELHPVAVDRWRQGSNIRREIQVNSPIFVLIVYTLYLRGFIVYRRFVLVRIVLLMMINYENLLNFYFAIFTHHFWFP